ncbi:OTU domain-containing protein 2 [Candida viswanathii]|uniref:OTU domain-containing protein 2 n=1 Tax=Candida viswanathii TaxID=5486 RepID=A0A367YJ27_9ASCO|nr:OTU domain-containing protein 2 [Candida viswanathii]
MSEEQTATTAGDETREALLQRHKKEQKDLIATITGLKKQATKKTRKSVLLKCQELEDNLKKKHQDELAKFDGVADEDEEEEVTPEKLLEQLALESKQEEPTPTASNNEPKKKRNRQKERLERRKQEVEKIKLEAAKEAENSIDYRKLEHESMAKILVMNELELFEIKPDGHCLFASIQDQLSTRHNKDVDIQELRDLAGEYMLENKDDFIPFLFDEETCELRDINDYVKELKTTAMWGSDMEILALAKTFNCPISVYMAGSSELKINAEGGERELKLGYFKHSYGLGEHYNSLRDLRID